MAKKTNNSIPDLISFVNTNDKIMCDTSKPVCNVISDDKSVVPNLPDNYSIISRNNKIFLYNEKYAFETNEDSFNDIISKGLKRNGLIVNQLIFASLNGQIVPIIHYGPEHKAIMRSNTKIISNTNDLNPGDIIKKYNGAKQVFVGQFYSSCFKNQYKVAELFYKDFEDYQAVLEKFREFEKDIKQTKINLLIDLGWFAKDNAQNHINNLLNSSNLWTVDLVKKPTYIDVDSKVILPENFAENIINVFKNKINETHSHYKYMSVEVQKLKNYTEYYNYLTISKDKAKKCYIDDFITFQ